jgi:hypothetical protein
MLHNNYTLTNTTAIQKIFNATANGAVTLIAGKYIIEMVLLIAGMSSTGGNLGINLKGAGTANLLASRAVMDIVGIDSTNPATPAARTGTTVQGISLAAPVLTNATGTGAALRMQAVADLTAGTMIPSLTLANGVATANVQAGSYIRFVRVAPTATATVGNWS